MREFSCLYCSDTMLVFYDSDYARNNKEMNGDIAQNKTVYLIQIGYEIFI